MGVASLNCTFPFPVLTHPAAGLAVSNWSGAPATPPDTSPPVRGNPQAAHGIQELLPVAQELGLLDQDCVTADQLQFLRGKAQAEAAAVFGQGMERGAPLDAPEYSDFLPMVSVLPRCGAQTASGPTSSGAVTAPLWTDCEVGGDLAGGHMAGWAAASVGYYVSMEAQNFEIAQLFWAYSQELI
jgi:hypothetical protein